MPNAFPPKKAGQVSATGTDLMRMIQANEVESVRSGDCSPEEAETELDALFKELDAEVAAGRVKP